MAEKQGLQIENMGTWSWSLCLVKPKSHHCICQHLPQTKSHRPLPTPQVQQLSSSRDKVAALFVKNEGPEAFEASKTQRPSIGEIANKSERETAGGKGVAGT